MNSILKRILTVVLSLLLIVYVVYQGYSALYNPIRTMRAASGMFEDVISTNGFVLHNEMVINQKPSGVVDYLLQDGDSVAKDSVVAAVYETAQDASNQHKIQQLSDQIQQYQQLGSPDEAASIDIDVLDSEIEKSFLQLSSDVDSSTAENIESDRSDLVTLLDKKQLATGEIKDFSSQILNLQKQKADLSKNTGAQTGTVTAPVAGYFVSAVDGLENLYDTQKALSITADDVKKLLTAKPASHQSAVGKVITGFESYIVCNVDVNDTYKFKVGSTLSLRFLLSSVGEVPVTVAAINKSSAGCAIVLKCDYMSSPLSVIRRQKIEIVADSYTGIKVPDSDVYIVNGSKGVYIRNGSIVQFKKIEQIYSAPGYVVSAIDPSNQGNLQIYDEVIENGDDLYDGKVIK
jgi:hypothetical protein